MTLHIIGAGLAGLSAALNAVDQGQSIVLHEGTDHAGGRARSWHEPGLDRLIDNGTHMVVGANHEVFRYLRRIGQADGLMAGPIEFPIHDLVSGKHWSAAGFSTILSVLGSLTTLGRCDEMDTIEHCLGRSRLFHRFWDPLSIAVMNTPSVDASARVFRRVAARTLWRSQAASRPYLAREGLTPNFVTPALQQLEMAGVDIRFQSPLKGLVTVDHRVRSLVFAGTHVDLEAKDQVILALPWTVTRKLWPSLPDLPASPIINGHFRIADTACRLADGGFLGLAGGLGQWLFRRGDVLSVTISAAGPHIDWDSDRLADQLWQEIAAVLGLSEPPVACRIIKEKRATLYHTPAVEKLRPKPQLAANLFLAGDWTATGLPCTLESAILSGRTAVMTASHVANSG